MSGARFRLAVTGLRGQIVSALIERAPREVEIIALGRPQLELGRREAVLASLLHAGCDAIINAAAYTHVDKAESEPECAMKVNGEGAGNVAEAAAILNVPLLHISTDYVFDGCLDRPYREQDETNPTNVYGRSKLVGEAKIRQTHQNHIILRTAWVYSPFGINFVKSMLRLGVEREEVSVVMDQIGNPTCALDIADVLVFIAMKLKEDSTSGLRGTFHFTGRGDASWADIAEVIFQTAEAYGRARVGVRRITTQEYPTVAKRPTNSRLDNGKLESIYGIKRPEWRVSLAACVQRLLKEKNEVLL